MMSWMPESASAFFKTKSDFISGKVSAFAFSACLKSLYSRPLEARENVFLGNSFYQVFDIIRQVAIFALRFLIQAFKVEIHFENETRNSAGSDTILKTFNRYFQNSSRLLFPLCN